MNIGSDKMELTFLVDTGSPWFWVPLNTCTNCRAGATKYIPSSSYIASNKEGNASYVNGKFATGTIATEQVRITPNDDSIDLKLIGVDNENSMSSLTEDGILGLAPSADSGTDLYVEQLYKQKIIPEKTFGLDINDENSPSSIIFGGYDSTQITDPTQIKYVEIYDKTNWWTKHFEVLYGDTIVTSKGGLTVFDSGTSITTFSTNVFKAFQAGTAAKFDGCEMKSFPGLSINLWHCPCTSPDDFEDIGISLHKLRVFIDKANYVVANGAGQ
eukprot:CAMPEP_0205825678 /NCGR_PEP_ID=MMETSP0206-20130828/26091_1 /ASSEMBLY_ACC=CAM_ASM_000279 /TAXON_ID=36767 /ORGANISM="Euplotes focardii, Strain TN1" /LENGTH=270 /DNA_ID=CAMNT_0053124917 /DNA_START=218 /DNA_END=1030 /DNA_ORIENTATION=+